MRTMCLLSLILAGVGPYAAAQYCAPAQYQAQAYQAPAYQYQAYQYQQPYYAQKVVAQGVAVAPLIVTVPVDSKALPVQAYGTPYYYSVGEAFQARSAVRDVIREELRNFTQASAPPPQQQPQQITQPWSPPSKEQPLTQPLTQPPPPKIQPEQLPPPPKAQPPQIPQSLTSPPAPDDGQVPPPPTVASRGLQGGQEPPPPPVPAPDDVTPADLQAKLLVAFRGRSNCIACHGPAGKSKFKLVDDEERLLRQPSDKRWKVFGMASSGAMPPTAAKDPSKTIEPEHLQTLLQWAGLK